MAAYGITMIMRKSTRRKALSLTMIGGIVLAIVGVGVLIMMFSDQFGDGFQSTFCSVYTSLSILFPGDSVSPAGCGQQSDVSYEAVECPEKDPCVLDMVAAVSQCWQDYQGFMTESEMCEGWNVQSLPEGITEADVTQRLIENNLCPSQLENTDNGCGGADQLRFDGQIESGDFIIIEYRSSGTEEWIAVE